METWLELMTTISETMINYHLSCCPKCLCWQEMMNFNCLTIILTVLIETFYNLRFIWNHPDVKNFRQLLREREPPVSTAEPSGTGAVVTVSQHSRLYLKALRLSLMKLLVNLIMYLDWIWHRLDCGLTSIKLKF